MSYLKISNVLEKNKNRLNKLHDEIRYLEIDIDENINFLSKFNNNFRLFFLEDWVYQYDFAIESLCNHFNTKSLKGFGVSDLEEGIIAAGVALHYLQETQHHQTKHILSISRIEEEKYVWMDRFTIRNLELFYSPNESAKRSWPNTAITQTHHIAGPPLL